MEPKRILHIIGRMDRAGAETMLMNLYRVLDKSKYQFDFLYFTNDKCHYDDEIISLGGHIYRIPEDKYKNIISRTYKIYSLLKKKSFHAVHSHTLFSSGFHLIAMYFAKDKKRIIHSHNTSDVNGYTFYGRIYQKFTKLLINILGTKFVACGKEAGEYLFFSTKKIIQLPNAVDVISLSKQGEKHKNFIKKELNLTKDQIILCQIARMSDVKNHKFSINLAKKMALTGMPFHLIFVGDGVLKYELINLCKKENLEDKITFLGIRNDIPKILAGSDIMLMPSFYEGFPVVLVEAQAVGTPSIVSNKVSKEVDLGVNKIFFESLDNIDNWIDKINNINKLDVVDTEKRIKILSSNGFDINVSIKILENIYK